MLRKLLSGLTLAALVLSAPASGNDWPHEIIDSMDGQRLALFLKSADIAAGPAWQPEQTAQPPLTIAGALAALKAWAQRDAEYRNARVRGIELKPVHGHKHRWYYLLRLQQAKPADTHALYVAVLFNGTVVPVIAEPDAVD